MLAGDAFEAHGDAPPGVRPEGVERAFVSGGAAAQLLPLHRPQLFLQAARLGRGPLGLRTRRLRGQALPDAGRYSGTEQFVVPKTR